MPKRSAYKWRVSSRWGDSKRRKLMPKMMHRLTLLALAALIASCWAANGEVNICSNVVSNLFLPHVSNCSKYYLCMSEVAVPRECPADYYFDARDQQCVPVMEARCVPSCKARGLESFCYDRTCTKYVLCFDGTPVIQQCSDGLQYNAQTDRCDYPQYVDCADNLCIRQNNPDDIVYIASKAKCDKYFVCMNGLPMVQNCTSGLQYNPTTQSCDFPSRVNCTVEPTEEYPALRPSSSTHRRHQVSLGGRPLCSPPDATGCVLLLPEWTRSHPGLHSWPGVRCQARGVPRTTIRGSLASLVFLNKDPLLLKSKYYDLLLCKITSPLVLGCWNGFQGIVPRMDHQSTKKRTFKLYLSNVF
ncbi:uncharacterized protein LOC128257470 isoform X1 [Drosophila gunungcola]|uniref:uncharacterized protein LOC128257470 isoform X1 n=1 Tax=Drosophila gunungcola TaxID=103775 RepID=UPI0022E0514A|nr:uncharacterized protein LOC128257470 isoform X1 [Drosophila gunungcola]